jgi:hypothetical protein
MSNEQPAGIVVLVYDVPLHETPTTPSLQHVAMSIAAVSRLGPSKIIVDHAGPGGILVRMLGDLGVAVQALKKPLSGLADPDDMRLRLLNCRALLAQVETGLRDGKLGDERVRKELLFDIEALCERC